MRSRNPWRRFRRLTLGSYVRFTRSKREENGPKRGRGRASIDERWCTPLSTARRVRIASKYDEPSLLLHRCGEWCGVSESPANPRDFFPSFHALSAVRHAGMLAAPPRRRGVVQRRGSLNRSDRTALLGRV